MLITGYPKIAIIQLTNLTNQKFDIIEFSLDNNPNVSSIKLKNLKPNKTKNTGISSINANNNNLILNWNDTNYIVYKNIYRNFQQTIKISIDSIDENNNLTISSALAD